MGGALLYYDHFAEEEVEAQRDFSSLPKSPRPPGGGARSPPDADRVCWGMEAWNLGQGGGVIFCSVLRRTHFPDSSVLF